MYWQDEVKEKIKRKNLILFSKNSEFLQNLSELIKLQNHRVIFLWALELAEESVASLEYKDPNEQAPRNTTEAAKLWASGKVKMSIAKREILNCHALAKKYPVRKTLLYAMLSVRLAVLFTQLVTQWAIPYMN